MDKGYAAAMAYLFFFYLLSRINVYIFLTYQRNQADDFVAVEVKMLGDLIVYQIKIPVIEINRQDFSWFVSEVGDGREDAKTHPERERRFIRRIVRFYINHPARIRKLVRAFRYYKNLYRLVVDRLLKATSCEYFSWKTRFGDDDAAITGVAVGVGWAVKETLLVNLQRRIKFKNKPIIAVTPVFGENSFETELKCIFRVRLGNVISVSTLLFNSTRKEAVDRG
jgi:hypothetical protein